MLVPLLVGMDVSRDRHHMVYTNAEATARRGRLTVANDAQGAAELIAAIEAQLQAQGCPTVRVGLEATGVYAWHLALALSQPTDPPRPWTVYLLQPRTVHRHAAARPSKGPNTARQDPGRVAEVLSQPAWLPHPFRIAERTLALQRLTRPRRHLVQQLTRLKNHAASRLFLKANGLVIRHALDLWGAAAAVLLLEYQTVEELAAASLDTLVTRLQAAGRGRFADPEAVARAVQQAAQASFQLPGRLKEPVHQIVHWAFQDLRYVTTPLKGVGARIAREPLARMNRLLTIPGIGPVHGAGIVAEILDITWCPDDDHLAQFAGLTWSAWQSGP